MLRITMGLLGDVDSSAMLGAAIIAVLFGVVAVVASALSRWRRRRQWRA